MTEQRSIVRPGRVLVLIPIAIAVLALGAMAAMQPGLIGEERPDRSHDEWRAHLDAIIDRWHTAAAEGDGDTYFGLMTEDAVFLGTDPGERWVGAEFRAFAEPYFDGTEAWTYISESRHLDLSRMHRDGVVWWDEVVRSPKYGPCRATGVLVRVPDDPGYHQQKDWHAWKIAHYSLTFLVPNEIAAEVTSMTLTHEASAAPSSSEPSEPSGATETHEPPSDG